MSSESKAGQLAVALDTPDWSEFAGWCRLFGPRVGVLKVGLEAFVRWGPKAVEEARNHGARVFLDIKLHDIPNTVAGAVRAARSLGVDFVTAHAAGGREMLAAAVESGGEEVTILAVTVLTSIDEAALRDLGIDTGTTSGSGTAEHRVAAWARIGVDSGCRGIVCSPRETAALRLSLPPSILLVTPGIRLATAGADDQRRTASPSEALAAGADLLVVGRPLTRAPEPLVALEALLASC